MNTWILQRKFTPDELVECLERLGIPYVFADPIPFSDGLLQVEIVPPTPCVVYGATTMIKAAIKRGWAPGVFFSEENFRLDVWKENIGPFLLNEDARVLSMGEALATPFDRAFIRPDDDFKGFTGQVFTREELQDFARRVGCDDNLRLVISSPKEVKYEWRTFVVDGRVVSASQYRPRLDDFVAEEITQFAESVAKIWGPARAYVLDVCDLDGELKVVEYNCINGAGFYRANMQKIVEALTDA